MKKLTYIILAILLTGCVIKHKFTSEVDKKVIITSEIKTGFGKRTYKVEYLGVWFQAAIIKTKFMDIGNVGDTIILKQNKRGYKVWRNR